MFTNWLMYWLEFRYDGLFIQNIGEFLGNFPEVEKYLPDTIDRPRLPK